MNDEALTVLCLRFLDGECTLEECESLGERLASDPSVRALYRDVCRQAVWLREMGAGTTREEILTGFEQPLRSPSRLLAASVAAAAAVVVLHASLGRWGRPEPGPAGVPAVLATPAAPMAGAMFLYPFEEFPLLDASDESRPATGPLDVPNLGDPDARVVRIARHLNGLPPLPSLSL